MVDKKRVSKSEVEGIKLGLAGLHLVAEWSQNDMQIEVSRAERLKGEVHR